MKLFAIYMALFIFCLISSCSQFLDLKPDQKMAIPSTLEHCELLLNDYSAMNTGYPSLGVIASDDYYINSTDWKSIEGYEEQHTYIWNVDLMTIDTHWQNPYRTVFLSNQILDILSHLTSDNDKYNKVLGAAHFFRAFAFHQIASVFTLPYQSNTADKEMGIPLRLKPAMDYKSVRSTLKETYEQIINDYKEASRLLPINEILKGRPHKAAAYAGLARLYLDMQDYQHAYDYADSSLQVRAGLIDYKELNANDPFPIARFNKEVLFAATGKLSGMLGQYFSRVDSNLYQTYDVYDYRKTVFFKNNDFDPNTYAFKGSYDNSDGYPFVGLTVSEIYLIKAETALRLGKVNEALITINELLVNRIDASHFVRINETVPADLLSIILDERRKELIFRGQRWSDLKRLNHDNHSKKTLIRIIDGIEYKLEPNSYKYAHLIPDLVISESGIPQNKR